MEQHNFTPITGSTNQASFTAKENVACSFCGEMIFRGQPLTWNRKKAGMRYHPDCLAREEKQTSEAPITTTVATPVVTETVVPDKWQKLHEIVRLAVREELAKATTEETPRKANVEGLQHKNFADLLLMAEARQVSGMALNIWIAGPAGTGKTTAASNVAASLQLPFYSMGSLSDPTQLVGYLSPVSGHYVTTQFRQAFELGGVILLDEIDGSDPNVLLVINQALANESYGFADRVVRRHKDCIVICCANTWGLGATNEYVGRLKMDAAFLDRFVSLDWPIDETLESATCPNKDWVKRVQKIRANIKTKGIKVLVTPRASYYGAALLATGLSQERVEFATLRKGMTAEQWELVRY